MAILTATDIGLTENNPTNIKRFLEERGIWFEQWQASVILHDDASQDEVLNAYAPSLQPFMLKGGYATADVINVNSSTPELISIRQKFLREHTHTEDEIRFFVDGQGLFWFNLNGEVFSLLCQAGDLISVPANTKHWFDLGPSPFVKAIRIFIDKAGWIPHYTNSKIDEIYNPKY